jgi:aspartate 1-decarboxylase
VIILSYDSYDARELADFHPRIVRVDFQNRAYLGPTAM